MIFPSPGAIVDKKKIIGSVHAEAGSRSIGELETGREQLLVGLIELRAKPPNATPTSQAAAMAC